MSERDALREALVGLLASDDPYTAATTAAAAIRANTDERIAATLEAFRAELDEQGWPERVERLEAWATEHRSGPVYEMAPSPARPSV